MTRPIPFIYIKFKDEDASSVPEGWKPPVPDLSPEKSETKDDVCPCPTAYTQVYVLFCFK